LREFGISNQKAGYILDIAGHFNQSPGKFASLQKFSDEEVIQTLTEIKGIGVWTAQMFLMFTLGRPDVFPVADLGIKNAMIRVYKWRTDPDKDKMLRASLKWAPHRTAVSRYLWHSLANEPQ
jgi:DNA-3-methyladenine glycosylase II